MLKIVLRGRHSVFDQIVEQYRRYIKLGVLRDGDKLPSCRELATELGINPNTVVRAYAVLEDEGLIKVILKKGAYVCGSREATIEDVKSELRIIREMMIPLDKVKELLQEVYEESIYDSD